MNVCDVFYHELEAVMQAAPEVNSLAKLVEEQDQKIKQLEFELWAAQVRVQSAFEKWWEMGQAIGVSFTTELSAPEYIGVSEGK